MSKLLYLECFSGISGDMSVSALLDLGAEKAVLMQALESLSVTGYKIEVSRMKKCGIDACHFDVILERNHHSHNHDHNHHHNHDHNHHHEHHDHDHHHEHEHRNLPMITTIIEKSNLTERAKKIAKNIFDYVADAEAKAHGIPKDEVHFHEVGAVDSIVDIVAVAVCIDNLDIHEVCVSTIYEGQGYVKCQHGVMPVPVPAVVNIAKVRGLPIRITDNRGEMITPTGIAIAAALKNVEKLPENYSIQKVGIGCGKKDFKNANILRAMLIEDMDESVKRDEVMVLETNIDDCTGEALAYTMEKLLEIGAKDAYFTPIYMKKNRPATMLTVLCDKEMVLTVEDVIFSNLSTIGIRKYMCERTTLERVYEKVETTLGVCTFKICKHNGKTYAYPEYEDVKKICEEKSLEFDTVFYQLKAEGNSLL